MAVSVTAYFGAPDDLDSNEVSYSTETITIMDGLKETQHVKTTQMTLKREATLCDAYGISDSGDVTNNTPGLILESVNVERQEVVSNPCFDTHTDFLNAGEFVPPDGTKVIQYVSKHLWLGITERVTLSGKYKGSWNTGANFTREILKQGRRVTSAFRISPAIYSGSAPTAYGGACPMTENTYPHVVYTAETDASEQFIVQESTFVQGEDWHTFNVVLYRKLGVASGSAGATSTLLASLRLFNPADKDTWKPTAAWQGYDPIADGNIDYYSITTSFSLSAGDYAKLTETIVVFPSDETDAIIDLETPALA